MSCKNCEPEVIGFASAIRGWVIEQYQISTGRIIWRQVLAGWNQYNNGVLAPVYMSDGCLTDIRSVRMGIHFSDTGETIPSTDLDIRFYFIPEEEEYVKTLSERKQGFPADCSSERSSSIKKLS